MKAYIQDIAYYLPTTVLTNEQIAAKFPEWSAEKVAGKVGITERHIAADNETATDMAQKAAEQLFAQGVDKSQIDFVLLRLFSAFFRMYSARSIRTEQELWRI